MGAFDKFDRREEKIRQTIEIDDSLYEELSKLSQNVYDASVNKLINASIEELIKTEDIKISEKENKNLVVKHSLLLRRSLIQGLEKLKEKYDISLYKLVNMAINNALNQFNANKDKN